MLTKLVLGRFPTWICYKVIQVKESSNDSCLFIELKIQRVFTLEMILFSFRDSFLYMLKLNDSCKWHNNHL